MRKAAIFIALVALLVLFAACQPVEKAEEPEQIPDVPITTGKVNITILPPPAENTQTQSSGVGY